MKIGIIVGSIREVGWACRSANGIKQQADVQVAQRTMS